MTTVSSLLGQSLPFFECQLPHLESGTIRNLFSYLKGCYEKKRGKTKRQHSVNCKARYKSIMSIICQGSRSWPNPSSVYNLPLGPEREDNDNGLGQGSPPPAPPHLRFFWTPYTHPSTEASQQSCERDLLSPSHRWANWGTERLQNFPEITQVEGVGYKLRQLQLTLSRIPSYTLLNCEESQPLNCNVGPTVTLPAGLLCGWSMTVQVNNQPSTALAPQERFNMWLLCL